MAYKKYITKNGKVYGPYIYHSRRVNGKVISEYRGPKTQTPSRKIFLPIIAAIFLVGIFLAIFSINGNLTGQATLELSRTYQQNLPLSGTLNFNLQQGELIPSDSKIIFEQENIKSEYLLSDLTNQETTSGDFYLENSDLSGQGEGYGIIGSTNDYQTVYFKLKLITENGSSESSGGTTETPVEETETPAEETSNETITDQVGLEEESESTETSNETITVETSTDIPSKEIIEPIETETPEPVEETSKPVETPSEETIEPETPVEEPTEPETPTPKESTPEPTPTEENIPEPETTITGNIIRGVVGTVSNFFLGLTPTGQISLDLEKEIQGDVIEGNPFEYTLKNEQTIEIVEGSVRTDSQELSPSVLDISQEDRTLTIQTDYSEGEECFGQECFGEKELTLSIDISELNLLFNEGNLKISIISQDQEIISIETTLEENISIQTETPEAPEEDKEPTIETNETNETIELNKTNTTLSEIQNLSIEELELIAENIQILNKIKQTAKEYKEWIIIKITFGEYFAEFTYDKNLPQETLDYLIEKDRINWLKDLAYEFSEEESEYLNLENLTQEYNLTN